MKKDRETYLTDFEVRIASVDGESVTEVVPIKVPVWKDEETGEEILTPEALELIDRTHARHLAGLSAKTNPETESKNETKSSWCKSDGS